jgi:hypothetical protein
MRPSYLSPGNSGERIDEARNHQGVSMVSANAVIIGCFSARMG